MDRDQPPDAFARYRGMCPVCEMTVNFLASGPYYRSALRCDNCGSVPRHRILMKTISEYFPKWRDLRIHESSPGWDKVSQRLTNECRHYIASQYDPSVPPGNMVEAPRLPCKRYQSENLEAQTFPDDCFDLVVAQDVFEHIFRPDSAIKEVARTLKPGGAIIMTVPIVMKAKSSHRRARSVNGHVEHLMEAQFHGNPLSEGGSLVTIDWGYDIVSYLQYHSGLSFLMIQVDNIDLGIRADLNEVLVGWKLPPIELG